MPAVTLNAVHMLALAALGVVLGEWLRRRIRLLERLHIPGSICGGLVLAVAGLFVRVEADTTLRDVLMIAFFTTIGMNASWRIVRAGGGAALMLLAVAVFGAGLQNAVGALVARGLSLDPLIGVLAGAVSLAGGPATSLAFGQTFEKLGVPFATAIAVASATFGIAISGLVSGAVGGSLIRRHQLKPEAVAEAAATAESGAPPAPLLPTVVAMALAMGLGSLISAAIERTGVILPAYIGAMIAASVLRNLDDRTHWLRIEPRHLYSAGVVALYFFIVMTLATLQLRQVAQLAAPVLVILAVQVAMTALLSRTLAFYAMGQDYEAAISAGGFCGFMLGVTANAVACMEVLTRKFGPAPRSYLTVPLVGGFLIDFTNSLLITVFANLLR